jgi:hypothetical protein
VARLYLLVYLAFEDLYVMVEVLGNAGGIVVARLLVE